jgi:gamma-glutamyltranspeptidase/glutathione hydrolase
MVAAAAPFGSVRAPRAAVAAADQLATQAAMHAVALGGNAVDAAIAANAVMTVVGPHLCGLGGDLFALVCKRDDPSPAGVVALNAAGRAGSGVDAERLRNAGYREVPFRRDPNAVPVPGCVDGWLALHGRFASLPLATLLEPAARLAADGFPASPLLVGALAGVDTAAREALHELATQARRPGDAVRRPGMARTLRAIAAHGRAGFYGGEFGEGLLRLGEGVFDATDLERSQADWVTPLTARAFGVELATIPPSSQGYLTLAAAALASDLGLPDDPDDPRWAHVLVECATAAGYDRPAVLHDEADGEALLRAAAGRAHLVDPERASHRPLPALDGDTTYLCTADETLAVSLIQSNAAGFGSWLVEPSTGINLHNRGIGFSLAPGHPAELAPGRRPPHTLSPALARRNGALAAVFGSMGGDAQPQILLQLAARLFHHGQSPAVAIHAGRWALRGAATGFDTWTGGRPPVVTLEGHVPSSWRDDLSRRGHQVEVLPAFDSGFGHAHTIVVEPTGMLAAAADPRARVSSAAGV